MLVPWNVRKRSVTIHRKGFFEMKTKRMLASLFAAVSIVTCTAVTASAEAPQGLKNGMTNGFVSGYSQGLKRTAERLDEQPYKRMHPWIEKWAVERPEKQSG